MEGGCHCGAIKFKTKKNPFWVGACYCIDCRKVSGSPNTIFAGYHETDIEIVKGTPKEYQSSENVVRTFCGECSSPYSYGYIGIDKTNNDFGKIFIPIGIFNDPSLFKINKHIWVSQKIPQIQIHDNIPQREK